MKELLTSKEIAEYLKLDQVTVRRKAIKGEIPAIRIGRRLRFDRDQIDNWLLRARIVQGINILVVDDDPPVGKLFKVLLEGQGYQVAIALDGLEALGLVEKQRFDLIFLDLLLPELDGAELFQRIRQIDKHVPVAIITGYPDSNLMAKAMEQGPFLVMKKPFNSDNILNTVHSFTRAMTSSS